MEYYFSSEDDYFTDTDDFQTLPKSGRDVRLSLEINYLPIWTIQDCFRELCQNWSDGMRESYDLDNRNFITKIDDTNARWLARTFHPGTKELIGYIRFQKQKGMVELTNFKAQLQLRSLNFGGGDKRDKRYLAGGHGDGYKAAAVVALRNKHQIRYEASSCSWRFHVGRSDKEQLYCYLKPMKSEFLQKSRAQYDAKFGDGRSRDETNYICKDVSVKIGNVYSSKTSPGLKITEQVFRQCIKVSLDLVSPSAMITTLAGDLILDEEFKNKIYLKRLLIDGNPGIVQYRFGYHFYEGSLDRDRRRRPSTKKDALCLATIWCHVINKHPEYLAKYIDMIEDHVTAWADVYHAKDYVSKEIAEKMAQYYFDKDARRNIFYHDSRNGSMDIEIIKRSLKKEPQQLAPTIWDILRKYKLVRIPQEEQERLLNNAPEAQDNGTPYSSSVKRALMASLLLSPRTESLQLSFRSGAKADLDLLLCGTVLNINEKWLDFRASHEKTPCTLSRASDPHFHHNDCFSCHHVVFRLHELVLEELARHNDGKDNLINADSSLHQRALENLSQMPIMIEANATERPGEISVSWTDLDFVSRVHNLRSEYRVTLHREITCSKMRDNLLTLDQLIEVPLLDIDGFNSCAQAPEVCGCPEKIASQMDGKALFYDLDPTNEYFPMVARSDPQSFFGVPPNAVRPLSHSFQLPTRSSLSATQFINQKFENSVPDESENLCDASDIDDDAMDVRMELPGPQSSGYSLRNDNNIEFQGLMTRSINHEMLSTRQTINQVPKRVREPEQVNAPNASEHRSERDVIPSNQNEGLTSRNEVNPGGVITGHGERLHEIYAKAERLKESFQVLRVDLQSKEEELHAANILVESLQTRDVVATENIRNLEDKILELRKTIEQLEADLIIAQDINDKRDQLAANRAARMRSSNPGLKREIKDEDKNESGSARGRKSARGDNSNQARTEHCTVLD